MLGGLEGSKEGGVETTEEAKDDAHQEGGGIVWNFLPRCVEEATVGNGQGQEPNEDCNCRPGDGLYRLGKCRQILFHRHFSFAALVVVNK